jgi:hypothetical protein
MIRSSPQILPVSLVVVSDYEPGAKSWADERACIAHYLADPIAIPAEVVIVASRAEALASPPGDLGPAPVPVRVVLADATCSAGLKNASTEACAHELIAVIEADCLSQPGWLWHLWTGITQTPSLAAVSGLTLYPPAGALSRVMGLLDRGFIENRDRHGRYHAQISSNAALFRREFLRRFPLREDPNPFVVAEERIAAAELAGVPVGLVRAAVQYHAFGGWSFLRDVRRNKGVQEYRRRTIRAATRPDPAWDKSGRLVRPFRVVRRRFQEDCRTSWQNFSQYCRPQDLPLLLVMIVLVRVWEWQGAVEAHHGRVLPDGTAYR